MANDNKRSVIAWLANNKECATLLGYVVRTVKW